MDVGSWLVIILVAVGLVIYFVARARAKKAGTGVAEEAAGICSAAWEQTVHKQRNKDRILELLQTRQSIDNAAVRAELKVSRSSAGRYLEELEAAGRIEQLGTTGQSVAYRLR